MPHFGHFLRKFGVLGAKFESARCDALHIWREFGHKGTDMSGGLLEADCKECIASHVQEARMSCTFEEVGMLDCNFDGRMDADCACAVGICFAMQPMWMILVLVLTFAVMSDESYLSI